MKEADPNLLKISEPAYCDLVERREHVNAEINASWIGSIRNRDVPHREFNVTVGELPPLLNDRCKATLWRLIDNFAGFGACCLNGQFKFL